MIDESATKRSRNPNKPRKRYVRDPGRTKLGRVSLPPNVREMIGFDQTQKALDLRARSSIYKLVKKGLLHPVKVLGATKFYVDEVRKIQSAGA